MNIPIQNLSLPLLANTFLTVLLGGCVIEAPAEDGDGSETSDSGDGDGDSGDGDGDPGDGDGDSGDGDGDTGDGDGDSGDGDGDPGTPICPGSEEFCTEAESHCDPDGLLQICQYVVETDCIEHFTVDCGAEVGPGSMCTTVSPTEGGCTEPIAFPNPDALYRLRTEFQGPNKCLEGNEASSPDHGGNAFMDDCQDVTGQLWRFVPEMVDAEVWYRMKTEFQGDNKCLEGNDASSQFHDGAAFMDDCQNATGQLWQLVAEGDSYRLQTNFQGPGKCMEGNESGSPEHNGSAFMNDCQDVTGQLWLLEEVI